MSRTDDLLTAINENLDRIANAIEIQNSMALAANQRAAELAETVQKQFEIDDDD